MEGNKGSTWELLAHPWQWFVCLQDFQVRRVFKMCLLPFLCLAATCGPGFILFFSCRSSDPSLLDGIFIWISEIFMNALWISWIPGPGALFHPVWSLLSLFLLSLVNKSDKSPCPVVQLSNGTPSFLLSQPPWTVAVGIFNCFFNLFYLK